MPDIFDLIPSSEVVEIGDTQTTVRPIQLGDCLQIVNRFPKLRSFLEGGKTEVSFGEILSTGAVPAICAAGCGRMADESAEEHFAALDADTQTRFLGPILRLTMPRGVAPFLVSLGAFAEVLSGPPQPTFMTREEIAQKLVRKNSGKSSPSSSPNIEEQLASASSGQ
jgi:hypothetical protein